MAGGAVNVDQFEFYFKKADLDQDGRVSGAEAVSFFQASGLPKPVLAQIWTYADQNRAGYLGRPEFYNYLKLVTVAQRKQELTPNIVKAALYGPASARIPPPQINLGAISASQPNINAGPPAVAQGIGIRGPQGYSTHQNQVMAPPGPSPAMPGGSTMLTSNPPGSTFSVPKPNGSIPSGSGSRPNDSSIHVTGNGIASNSTFGDAFSAVSSQARNNIPVSGGTQLLNKPSQPIQTNVPQQPTVNQNSNFGHNQQVSGQNSSNFSVRVDNVPSNQSSQTWPKMSPTSIQKYTKVFMEVDTDRDGKVTGEQARNLFLSWRLPREILKQVWDLSDQDNDSMLSLKEFCIALYLMERFREGRPLPKVLPSNIFEGTPFPPAGQIQSQVPSAYGAPVYRPPPGVQQAHVMTGPRQVTPGAAKPPRPVPLPVSEPDEQIKQRKQAVPLLEKHLVDQLSTEEQKALNSKFQEATEADKKVSELEKEILEARQKIEFYRNKMQEIVLYKSRCDSRLNEITERVSADRREVESLSKKYEDKYKQAGDVASKLSIEEATFRDIQDKKMELYRAIVKLEQDGKPDEIQARADRIQADLEEQVRTLNERCKMYGLRGKPTLLVELPFGWQTGIQEGAADWDENWDKFEDEGFTFVKELTLDVQNVIAPPKSKSLPHENKSTSQDSNSISISDSDADKLNEKKTQDSEPNENEKEKEKEKEKAREKEIEKNASEKTPPDSPNKNIFHENSNEGETSPHASNTHGEHSDGQSVISGDKGFEDAGWGTFDTSYDSDAAWDFNARKPKEMDEESTHENSSLFDSGDIWGGLNPIRTEIPKKATFTFDSVPGTPAYSYSGSPPGENLFQNRGPFSSTFTDSVPSTPAYSYTGGGFQQPFSSSAFADSVPSTPMSMYATNSPRGGREEHAFTNNFSRFDSFSSSSNAGFNDGGLFPSREVDSFSRFDSFRSTAQESEYDQGFSQPQTFARFDSMRSNADSDFGHSLFQPRESFSRFDSMRSTNESAHSFPSFDDVADPFGSHDPFKTGSESGTPRRDSVDGWKAF